MNAASSPTILVRAYKGSSIEQASMAYAADARTLVAYGYQPVGQSFEAPAHSNGIGMLAIVVLVMSWGIALTMPYGSSGAATFGPLLIFGGTGLAALLAVGAIASRRPGTLTVTFQLAQAAPTGYRVSAAAPPPSAADRAPHGVKVCPRCAEQVKAAALICRYCRFEFGGPPNGGRGS